MKIPFTAVLASRLSGLPPLWHAASQNFLRFFLPWACAGCRTPLGSLEDDGFCGTCWLRIPRILTAVCASCGVPLRDGGSSCFACRTDPLPLRVRAAALYEGSISAAIHRFKYGGRVSLARPFTTLLRQAWNRYPELHRAEMIVPVPLHTRQQRLRGYNQAEVLAEAVSGEIGRPVLQLLARVRKTKSQTRLSRPARRHNITGAFALLPEAKGNRTLLKGRSVLLVDDVCTTGNTLLACFLELRKAQMEPVGALVLARDL